MTCPGTYPTVLNGQVFYNDSTTVEYECLTGFSMSGNKRITCSAGVWQTTPTCTAIRQYDEVNVFPDWWFYVLAALLALLILAIFLCIICRFCHCWCCRCCDSAVNPHHQHGRGVTTVEEVGEDPAQVYFVPVHATTPTQTRSDGDLNDRPLNPKKPAKEVKAWLPHRHPVRNINTSTK